MKYFDNGTWLIEDSSELPNMNDAQYVYLDFETTSRDERKKSINPWHDCWLCGVCVTVDDYPNALYIPVECRIAGAQSRCVPKPAIQQWIKNVVSSCGAWVNHNIKYDAHVYSDFVGETPDCDLIDTLTLAKLIDSDKAFSGGYGLDVLSKDWLNHDISHFENEVKKYLKYPNGNTFNNDYGLVPLDVIAPYGGQDVLTVRSLSKFIKGRIPIESFEIAKTEIQLTSVLLHMERFGLCIDRTQLEIEKLKNIKKMVDLQRQMNEEVGFTFNPNSPKDVYDVLINTYGLPVLMKKKDKVEDGVIKKGGPSFDKKALREYLHWPESPKSVVGGIADFRKADKFNGLFVDTYLDLAVSHNGVLKVHPEFNQIVRTGRLSCKNPNAQQLNKKAKSLIHCADGWMFISVDYSQIEFRLIVHYIQNQEAIEQYKKDPDIDFHSWVQSVLPAKVSRSRAKTINFSMGYGSGKRGLSENMDLMDDLREGAGTNRELFLSRCRQRGSEIYDMYHGKFPELKEESNRVANIARSLGYATNLHGRRRHLTKKVAHIAFNSIGQSDCADMMKERMVVLFEMCKGTDVFPVVTVHDELLFTCPKEVGADPRTISDLVSCMESPRIASVLSVPIRCDVGISTTTWADCGDKQFKIPYGTKCNNLEHLK